MTEDALPESDRVPGAPHPREAPEVIGQDGAVRDFLAAAQAQQAQQARFAPVMVAPAEPENIMVRPTGQQPMGQPRLQQVRAQMPAATAQRPDWCLRAAPTTQAGRDYVRQVCGQG